MSKTFKFCGVLLGPESLDVLGTKPAYQLTAKIPGQSGGAVTEAKSTLLLMNFEAYWTSRTCYDGLTVTHVGWKPKGEAVPSLRVNFGSPQMSIRDYGTPI